MLTISKSSHLDHIPVSVLNWVQKNFADRSEFFCEEVELPPEIPEVVCALHGPAMGDEPLGDEDVFYASRNGRETKSRLCRRETRTTRKLVVVAGPDDGLAPGEIVLYTAYGGPMAPREPDDPSIAGRPDLIAEAKEFWAQHALSE